MSGRLGCSALGAVLCGVEGELVSVRVLIEPRSLERALEALARLDFPINPQICHDAAVARPASGGAERLEPAVAIEFPAWTSRLDEVRAALQQSGLDSSVLKVSNMLSHVRGSGLVA